MADEKIVDLNGLAYQTEKMKTYINDTIASSGGIGVATVNAENSYYVNPHNCRVEITESGTWTVPDDIVGDTVDVFLVGGGGGSTGVGTRPGEQSGGGGGYTAFYKDVPVSAGENISIVIGAGGTSASTATKGGYTRFKSSAYQVLGGYTGSRTAGGKGGSGGAFNDISYTGVAIPGINGSYGIRTVTINDEKYVVLGAEGQRETTTDPYSGIRYSDGGSQSNKNKSQYGQGGCGYGNQTGASSYALVYRDGNPGICVIYYSTKSASSSTATTNTITDTVTGYEYHFEINNGQLSIITEDDETEVTE